MEFFRIRRDIPFMRYAVVLNVISAVTFAAAVFFIATRGLHFSVEFTGGTLVEVAYPQAADLNRVRNTVSKPVGYARMPTAPASRGSIRSRRNAMPNSVSRLPSRRASS